MKPLLSPHQMAEADSAAIEAGTPAHVLMERAGRAVARAAIAQAGGRYGKKAVVVCGKGNNGGDGFVAARLLANEGLTVTCTDAGGPFESSDASLHHRDALRRRGIEMRPFDPTLLDDADVVIDAIFGTGFRGAAEGAVGKVIESIAASSAPVVSVDIPSGVAGATGAVEGPAVRADRTVAIAGEKLGTAVGSGATHAGRVDVVDIGIPLPAVDAHKAEASDVARLLPSRKPDAHKRSNGSVAVLAGSTGMSGAALLCCEGAMRSGAGYVTLGSTVEVVEAANAVIPEVLKRALWDGNGMSAVSLERFADVIERADSVVLGPGLRDRPGQRTLVHRALASIEQPVVLDADGLNVLVGDASPLIERDAATVITPHPGELARLVDRSTTDIGSDRVEAARAAARDLRCVVLLKGFRTVVAEPTGRVVISPTGGPELATAGTGDVLSGVIGALLGQGLGAFEAAWAGAYVHGLAGEVAARGVAGRGVMAWDVAEAVPEALAELAPLG